MFIFSVSLATIHMLSDTMWLVATALDNRDYRIFSSSLMIQTISPWQHSCWGWVKGRGQKTQVGVVYVIQRKTENIIQNKVSKSIFTYHFTPIRMATIKNQNETENNKSWWGYGEIGTLVHCLGECKMLWLL